VERRDMLKQRDNVSVFELIEDKSYRRETFEVERTEQYVIIRDRNASDYMLYINPVVFDEFIEMLVRVQGKGEI
jgi:hypothetical protein